MKKIFFLFLTALTLGTQAQNIQVQNMINYLRNKDLAKAKASADAAAEHESTKNTAKMWINRGHVYKAIYSSTVQAENQLDTEAEEKALEAYTNCLKLDKGKDIYKDEAYGPLVDAANYTKRKASVYANEKQFEKALRCYELLENALPYDDKEALKRSNISKDKLAYDKFDMYYRAENLEKAKEYAEKLAQQGYKDRNLYVKMMGLSLKNKDTTTALQYIEKGKALFEDDFQLIANEIDIYMARKKTTQLVDKLKAAIELTPDNDLLHAVLGQVYEKTGDMANAEKSYLKAVELKPDNETVNYKLGAMYFNLGADYNSKYNDLPPKEVAKAKEYEQKVKDNFTKAAPYLEKAYEVNPDPAYKQRLFKIYMRLGDTGKAAQYK